MTPFLYFTKKNYLQEVAYIVDGFCHASYWNSRVRRFVIRECGKSRTSTFEVASDDKYVTRTVKTLRWYCSLRGQMRKA
jgi:hypothetical protein